MKSELKFLTSSQVFPLVTLKLILHHSIEMNSQFERDYRILLLEVIQAENNSAQNQSYTQ